MRAHCASCKTDIESVSELLEHSGHLLIDYGDDDDGSDKSIFDHNEVWFVFCLFGTLIILIVGAALYKVVIK